MVVTALALMALMNIESDILNNMDFSDITERFAADTSRKQDFYHRCNNYVAKRKTLRNE